MQRRGRLAASLILGVIVLGACSSDGNGDRPGVGVRSINTNIGLGIELEDVAPPNTAVPAARAPRRTLDAPEETVPPFEFDIPARTNRPCPVAGPFDFPDVEASVEPQGRPAAGAYDWKADGEITTGSGVFTIDLLDTRTIANVEDHPSIPDAFTFEVTENVVDERQNRGTITTRYRITPRPFVEQEQLPNDAGKGLFIEARIFKGTDSQGRPVESEFNPVPAIQLMAFPVQDGAAIDSRGTDPATLAEESVVGVVKGHKQIDACGDRVDTWFVDADRTFRYTDSRTGQTQTEESNYDYGVATQFGGLIIYEHLDVPKDAPVLTLDLRVGEVPRGAGG